MNAFGIAVSDNKNGDINPVHQCIAATDGQGVCRKAAGDKDGTKDSQAKDGAGCDGHAKSPLDEDQIAENKKTGLFRWEQACWGRVGAGKATGQHPAG
jgi:hypothetical protein